MLRVTAVRDPDHGVVSERPRRDGRLALPHWHTKRDGNPRSPSEMNRRARLASLFRLQTGGSSSEARRREFPQSPAAFRCGIRIRESLRSATTGYECKVSVPCTPPQERIASRG